jgi:hypothetical protein
MDLRSVTPCELFQGDAPCSCADVQMQRGGGAAIRHPYLRFLRSGGLRGYGPQATGSPTSIVCRSYALSQVAAPGSCTKSSVPASIETGNNRTNEQTISICPFCCLCFCLFFVTPSVSSLCLLLYLLVSPSESGRAVKRELNESGRRC